MGDSLWRLNRTRAHRRLTNVSSSCRLRYSRWIGQTLQNCRTPKQALTWTSVASGCSQTRSSKEMESATPRWRFEDVGCCMTVEKEVLRILWRNLKNLSYEISGREMPLVKRSSIDRYIHPMDQPSEVPVRAFVVFWSCDRDSTREGVWLDCWVRYVASYSSTARRRLI